MAVSAHSPHPDPEHKHRLAVALIAADRFRQIGVRTSHEQYVVTLADEIAALRQERSDLYNHIRIQQRKERTTMRHLTEHKVNGLNEALEITAHEPTTAGGAPHRYDILARCEEVPGVGPRMVGVNLRFQSKPIAKPEDINGISNEALLAVVADRLRCSQEGPFKCRDNAIALTHIEDAMMRLHRRTRDRVARGVEGSLQA